MPITKKKHFDLIKNIDKKYLKYKHCSQEELISIYNTDDDLISLIALVKVVFENVLNVTLYDEQLLAIYLMCRGKIIEMKTGEGKSFVCMGVSLIRCRKEKVYIVTINNVLAERDCKVAKNLYDYLNKKIEYNKSLDEEDEDLKRNPEALKTHTKERYERNDCLYTSVSSLIFDFLDMKEDFILNSVIIDEIDYILIDNAVSQFSLGKENIFFTPHYKVSIENYNIALNNLDKLKGKEIPFVVSRWEKYYKDKELDYYFVDNHQNIFFTEKGLKTIEEIAIQSNLPFNDYFESAFYYVIQANHLYKKGRDYTVVSDNGKRWIELIDANNGRRMSNSQKEYELQIAIELKENITDFSKDSCSETISMQLFFVLFPFLTGMSGTVGYSKNEFKKNFKRKTAPIPTHLPTIREDYEDEVFLTKVDCYKKTMDILNLYPDSPFLIVCESENELEAVENYFKKHNIELTIFTNKNIDEEESIINSFKEQNTKVLTTNLFGRGTDIKISDSAKETTGLIVVIIGKFKNKRIEQQMRGRAGRQGEKGKSYCFYSVEDFFFHNVKEKHFKKIKKAIQRRETTNNNFLRDYYNSYTNKYTERMQKHVLAQNESHRYQVLHFDIVLFNYFILLHSRFKNLNMLSEIKKYSENIYEKIILKTYQLMENCKHPTLVENLYSIMIDNLILSTKADIYWQICDISNTMSYATLLDNKSEYLFYDYILPALKDYEKELLENIVEKILSIQMSFSDNHSHNEIVVGMPDNVETDFSKFVKEEYFKIIKNVEKRQTNI